MEPYILAGVFWMVMSGVASAVQAVVLAMNGLSSHPATWQMPLWFTALFGGALSWVFGIATRVVPGFLGSRLPKRGWVLGGFVLLQGGVLLSLASFLAFRLGNPELWHQLRVGANVAAALAIAATLIALDFLRRDPTKRAPAAPRAFRLFLRGAFTWFGVAAALMLWASVMELRSGHAAHHLLLDATRHTFVIGGFIMILMGMASRIVPVFEGVPLQHPRLAEIAFHMLNLGVLFRLAQVGAAYVWPDLLAVAGVSGFFALAGLVLMAVVLFSTLARGVREERARGH
jgi:hypothetical protein